LDRQPGRARPDPRGQEYQITSVMQTGGARGHDQQAQIRVQLANNLVGIMTQQLLPAWMGAGAHPGRTSCWIANPAVRALIREGKSTRSPASCRPAAREGMI
ncbi:hypothetical protein CTI14_59590, partial [Methylobacterium radiotolerans]